MTKSPNRSRGSRRGKPTKTIDLTAEAGQDQQASDANAEAVLAEAETLNNEIDEQLSNAEGNDPASSTPDSTATKKSGTSIVAMFLSALLGGGAALVGSTYLAPMGLLGGNSSENSEVAALSSQLNELRNQVTDLANTTNDAGNEASALLPAINERLGALETQIGSLPTVAPEGGANSEEISAALEASKAASEKAEDVSRQVAALNDKIVESAGGNSIDMDALKSALSSDTELLSNRINALESAANAAPSNEVNGEIESKLTTLEEGISQLPDLAKQLESVSGTVSSLSEKSEGFSNSLGTIETRLGGLETSVNEQVLPAMNEVEKAAGAAIESQKVARSVSARALDAALEQGGKFRGELASAEALIGGSEAITGLKELAQKGVMTEAELLSSFDPVANRILALGTDTESDSGILGQFMASAKSLVKVRSATPIDGDSAAAIISRIEANLKSGDISTALSEWNGLPEEAKAVSSDWADNLRERQTAVDLIKTVIGELSANQGDQG